MRVFWEKGYVGASLEDLTSATGLGRGSLYGTFVSKDGLFRQALQRYSLLYGARFDAALARADTDPVGAVEAFFAVVLDRIADPTVPDGCLVAQATISSPTLEAETADHVREMLRAQHARVRSALDHTHPDKQLLDDLAAYVVGITQSLAVLSRGGMSAQELQSTARLACETVTRRLGEHHR
ncbi:TetR/AcrR family transcriptional regulator [Mycolicibacterium canariasense]|nr:TetR/AcrR family transcriptional regulator [Mycolicibacterium canariasense]